ncbi:MAG TPA: adenylate/guanylate cyclase domain-containing protein, partial [Chloroflexota bacterium]|nr:adenylate/guanylate cyclase domain-containing protein [Chloroflexota bacterium]
MPKFLRIGVHQSNVSGYTSKAWWIRRVGSTVTLKWGPVEVDGAGDGRKVYWTVPPREKAIRCRSVQLAKDYVKNAIARRD